ncbi:MAG: hypothetical protein KDA42_02905 [Planctomycetales bacterium]|nr:hypothetical protein [Planctomycetales bacterium]
MNELMLILIGLIAWVLIVAFATRWIMRPLEFAMWPNGVRATFTLIDFFGLVLVVQIPLALVRFCYPGDFAPTTVLNTIGVGTALAIWFVGIVLLSRAHVRQSWHRLLFTAVLLPFTIYGSLLFATSFVWTVVVLLGPGPGPSPADWSIGAGLALGSLAGLLACGWATRWIVRSANPPLDGK